MDKKRLAGSPSPTDLDVVPETLEILRRWGADAIRDCDGTDFPAELQGQNAKIYSTYYTTRKDNAWAKAHPEEVQQCYIMTGFRTAAESSLSIRLMKGISPELMQVNTRDDIKRWWGVMDRTTGTPLSPDAWHYDEPTGCVIIDHPAAYHEYTVAFLACLIWDPVHMYNAVTNDWKDVEHQITFDVRQPKTHAYTMERLRKFIAGHPYVNVVRYTTFSHQFTLVYDELKREKFVDWYGYSASVSPFILEQFEREVGYRFRPEFIVNQGYHNNQYRVPSREYKDFQAFQRREVAKLAREMVDITHELGKEAMMFLGDHWIGMEPFVPEFQTIGLEAVGGFTEAQSETQSGQKYSVVTLPDGKQFVRADRLVLFGNDSRAWSQQLEDYINGKIRRGEDVTLIGADGDELILTATSAGKLSSPYTSGGRTMSDEAFERKGNAAAHIDELAQTSTRGRKTVADTGARHGAMASDGWNYRTAYFQDFDGKYYEVKISVAQSGDGKMLYNIGQMQERSAPQINGSSSANTGAQWGNTSSKDSIRTNEQKSQEKFSAGQKYSPAAETVAEVEDGGAPVFSTAAQTDWAFAEDGSRYYRLLGIAPPGSTVGVMRKSARAMDWAQNGQKYTQELLKEVMQRDESTYKLALKVPDGKGGYTVEASTTEIPGGILTSREKFSTKRWRISPERISPRADICHS